ncbi:Hypothetical protein SMAX5B_022055 [Scophthalmus maximus]|uniref:Uncharacterized protein n=1 Tax=Scophthalmus maximus TaxID=52904 RepID=A0A2U9BUY5_SCOMX|nr:Hypothetical protein SMAX5B_022055 [Scophthalmus maximus]
METFKNCRKMNQISGNSPITCPHQELMEELIGHRPLAQAMEHGVDIGLQDSMQEDTLEDSAVSSWEQALLSQASAACGLQCHDNPPTRVPPDLDLATSIVYHHM